jgi:hypothetical protein
MMNLQEATMGDGRDGEGKKRLTQREIRYWGATIIGVIFALLITEWMAYFAVDNPAYLEGGGALRRFFPPGIAITGAAVLTIFFTGFIVYTYRIIDEQEREAFHWANTVSWNCACVMSMIWFSFMPGSLWPRSTASLCCWSAALPASLFGLGRNISESHMQL